MVAATALQLVERRGTPRCASLGYFGLCQCVQSGSVPGLTVEGSRQNVRQIETTSLERFPISLRHSRRLRSSWRTWLA